MIYKDIDNKEALFAVLERMYRLAGPDKKAMIARELRTMRAGIRNEREAAWLLDSWLKDATRTAVVHDLRLDLGPGRVAQIDHVLVHRTRRFFVLDTKGFAQGVRLLDDGRYLRWNDEHKRFDALPSPLLQGERNAAVLRQALAQIGVADAVVESLALVAPAARIERARRADTAALMKADAFLDKLNGLTDGPATTLAPLGGLLRTGLHDSIGDIAKKLVALHRPSPGDAMARFGLGADTLPAPAAAAPDAVAAPEETAPAAQAPV